MGPTCVIGIIGGSGLEYLDVLENQREIEVHTAFGAPSAPVLLAEMNGVTIAFIRRHGKGHTIPPSEINARANIAAFKQLGVRLVVSLSAVGSLDEEIPPSTFAIINQFIDRTYARPKTFFGKGLVGHVPFGNPVCARVSGVMSEVARHQSIPVVENKTYLVMEGPQFSTKAESELHRSIGASIIGMTAMPEAKLCREAEICYAMVAMVTDFDCWHEGYDAVTADLVSEVMKLNSQNAARLLFAAAPQLAAMRDICPCGCNTALDGAIMTAPASIDPEKRKQIDVIVSRVLGDASWSERQQGAA